MKVLSVVGARPQFVKLAPIVRASRDSSISHVTVHTGQHYDAAMSEVFFEELGIGEPEWNLGVGSGKHGEQTGAMLKGLEELFIGEQPDWVLIYGDTNSTLAAALAAVKLHLPVAHLEAGLRSFNRRMPEEHNRILSDHASNLLLAPTEQAAEQLAVEGLKDRTVVVGDVMVDILLDIANSSENALPETVSELLEGKEYILATIHRAENTDDFQRLSEVISALSELPLPVVFPVHPRVKDKVRETTISLEQGSLVPIEPLSYQQMVATIQQAKSVVTDSGGLQKEAAVLGKPVTTLRTETEWTETLEDNRNVLAADLIGINEIVMRSVPSTSNWAPYGEGKAAEKVIEVLLGR